MDDRFACPGPGCMKRRSAVGGPCPRSACSGSLDSWQTPLRRLEPGPAPTGSASMPDSSFMAFRRNSARREKDSKAQPAATAEDGHNSWAIQTDPGDRKTVGFVGARPALDCPTASPPGVKSVHRSRTGRFKNRPAPAITIRAGQPRRYGPPCRMSPPSSVATPSRQTPRLLVDPEHPLELELIAAKSAVHHGNLDEAATCLRSAIESLDAAVGLVEKLHYRRGMGTPRTGGRTGRESKGTHRAPKLKTRRVATRFIPPADAWRLRASADDWCFSCMTSFDGAAPGARRGIEGLTVCDFKRRGASLTDWPSAGFGAGLLTGLLTSRRRTPKSTKALVVTNR